MDELERRMRQQLDALFDGNETELARKIGPDQQQNVNNFITGKVKRSSLWREIAALLQISEDEMRSLMKARGRQEGKNTKLPVPMKVADFFPDMPQPNAKVIPLQPSTNATPRMLPVLGEAVGGDIGEYEFNGQVLDYIPCPPPLVNVPNAYVVFVDGESMVPRYMPGEIAFVHPSKPVKRNDHVVVQLRPSEEDRPPKGFIKKFVGWQGNKLVLEQYNPQQKIEFQRSDVVSVHLIVLSGDY